MNNVIKINIRSRQDYVSRFNDNILSNELSNYIMDECRGYELKSDIHIEITSDYYLDNEEKDKIVDMIRSNFGSDISEMLLYRKKNIVIDFITIILGIISLMFYLFSSNIPILSEFILVFSWVLIEESVYNLIFTGFSDRISRERRKKLTNCEIIFK